MNTKSEKVVGTVKFFDSKKGFGFIVVEGRPDAFFHASWLGPQGFSFQDMTAGLPATIDYGMGQRDRPAVLAFHQVGDKKATVAGAQEATPITKHPSGGQAGKQKSKKAA